MSNASAGLPVSNPTTSYWQSEADDSPLHDHGRDDRLPDDVVDVAIIGSGISGAVAAYMLQHDGDVRKAAASRRRKDAGGEGKGDGPSIVMLEARSLCGGATGRNGGHCRPDTFAGFGKYAALVGKEQAHKVLLNEWDTFTLTDELIEAESIECDWWKGRTLAVYRGESIKEAARSKMDEYVEFAGSLRDGVRFIDDENEAKQISRVKDALGAAVWPAGSLQPLRFVHGLIEKCLEQESFSLFTHTPVVQLSKDGGKGDASWQVKTSRGVVRARKVLLATNGYSTALLPSLSTFLTPHRSQCSAIIPPETFAHKMALVTTASIVRETDDYEYLTQQPSSGGPNEPKNGRSGTGAFILGGGHPYAPRHEQIGSIDDSVVIQAITDHLQRYPANTFIDWQSGQGEMRSIWTGIQGYTRDSLPLVGEHFDPQYKGIFLSLGHHGHGMARAATCARGVARLMLADRKETWDSERWEKETSLPHCYRWTEERSNRRDVDCRDDF